MTFARFFVILCVISLLFVLAKVYQYNLVVCQLYKFQRLENKVLSLNRHLEERMVVLEQLKDPTRLAEVGRQLGFVQAPKTALLSVSEEL